MSSPENAREAATLADTAYRALTAAVDTARLPGTERLAALEAVTYLAEASHEVEKSLRFAVLTAIRTGASDAEIGRLLGVSRQAVRQRFRIRHR